MMPTGQNKLIRRLSNTLLSSQKSDAPDPAGRAGSVAGQPAKTYRALREASNHLASCFGWSLPGFRFS